MAKLIILILGVGAVVVGVIIYFLLQQKESQNILVTGITPTISSNEESDLNKYFEKSGNLNIPFSKKEKETETCIINGHEVGVGTAVSGETCVPIITGTTD